MTYLQTNLETYMNRLTTLILAIIMTTTSASAMVNEHGKVLAVKKFELNTTAISDIPALLTPAATL